MSLFYLFLTFLTALVAVPSMEGCRTEAVLCRDIRNNAGLYIFPLTAPNYTIIIEADENGTQLALWNRESRNFSSDFTHFDDKVAIRRTCSNFNVRFIQLKADKMSQSCVTFTADASEPIPVDAPAPASWKIIVAVGIAVAVIAVAVFVGCRVMKKRCKKKRCGGSSREGEVGAQDQRASEENRLNTDQEQGRRLLNGGAAESDVSINVDDMAPKNADEENQLNTDQEQGRRLLQVGAAESEVSINMDDMAPKRDTVVRQVKAVLPREVQNGNERHDPGGDTAAGLHGHKNWINGGTLGGRRPDSDECEEQPFPRSQGSPGPGVDELKGMLVYSRAKDDSALSG